MWQLIRSNYKGELTEFDTHAIITIEHNEVVKPIHPTRMPVIFDPTDYDVWLTG